MNKAHVLEEIKRTAKENGGVPLGINKFVNETGIKGWDWQKYWARWSEAVREAGFTPNLLNSAYDESKLLDRYAKLYVSEFVRFIFTRNSLAAIPKESQRDSIIQPSVDA